MAELYCLHGFCVLYEHRRIKMSFDLEGWPVASACGPRGTEES